MEETKPSHRDEILYGARHENPLYLKLTCCLSGVVAVYKVSVSQGKGYLVGRYHRETQSTINF